MEDEEGGGGGILKQMGKNEHEASGEAEKGRAAGSTNIKELNQ